MRAEKGWKGEDEQRDVGLERRKKRSVRKRRRNRRRGIDVEENKIWKTCRRKLIDDEKKKKRRKKGKSSVHTEHEIYIRYSDVHKDYQGLIYTETEQVFVCVRTCCWWGKDEDEKHKQSGMEPHGGEMGPAETKPKQRSTSEREGCETDVTWQPELQLQPPGLSTTISVTRNG